MPLFVLCGSDTLSELSEKNFGFKQSEETSGPAAPSHEVELLQDILNNQQGLIDEI